jgi:hypothetical protein
MDRFIGVALQPFLSVAAMAGCVGLVFLFAHSFFGSAIWDEEHLRIGLGGVALVGFVRGATVAGAKSAPQPMFGIPGHLRDLVPGLPWGLIAGFVAMLTLLQYTSLDAGQPLFSVEHVVIHALSFAGLNADDLHAIRGFAHSYLRADRYWVGSLTDPLFIRLNVELCYRGILTWILAAICGAVFGVAQGSSTA